MYRALYQIAGISVTVIASIETEDNAAFSVYRRKGNELPETDEQYEILLMETDNLPQPQGKCVFQNEWNLVCEGLPPIHYFRIPGRRQICAWDLLETGTHKEIHYLAAYGSYFKDSVGVFNAAGFERVLYHFRKYLFHCSYVEYKERAVLFTAPSGGGKTTQGELWEKYADARMVNGDRAALEINEEGVLCHGLPIAGSSGIFLDRSMQAAAIVTLEKAGSNSICRLSGKDAVYAVFSQLTVNMWDKNFVESAFDFAITVVQRIPKYRLACTISSEAVDITREQVERILRT